MARIGPLVAAFPLALVAIGLLTRNYMAGVLWIFVTPVLASIGLFICARKRDRRAAAVGVAAGTASLGLWLLAIVVILFGQGNETISVWRERP